MVLHLESNLTKATPDNTVTSPRRPRVEPDLLSYHLLRPRQVGAADVALIGEAYRVWSEVWSETLLELDGKTNVPSDQFTRQDEVGAVFHGYECVALTCFRWVDLDLPMSFGDSYFEVWPESARAAAMRGGSKVCIGSHITVARNWRRLENCSLAAVITALCIERFMAATEGSAILGTMRDDRNMGALTKALGAEMLGQTELHGVPVSLVAAYRGSQRQPLDAKNEAIVRALTRSFGGAER